MSVFSEAEFAVIWSVYSDLLTNLDPSEVRGQSFVDVERRVKRLGGELLRQSALNDAIDALYGTGAFGSVNMRETPVDEESDPEVRDLDFQVTEKDARSFEVGGDCLKPSVKDSLGRGFRFVMVTSLVSLPQSFSFGLEPVS